MVGGCGARAVSRKTPIYFIPLQQTEVLYFNLALTLFSAVIAKSNFENNGNGSVSILRLTMMFESMSEYGNDEGNIGGVFKITNLGTR